uniref:G domain-containing protein n=1 Tax=Amphilophus citrinellus TaxID=61819 RepID=A0A3Q0SMC0_AMPCI
TVNHVKTVTVPRSWTQDLSFSGLYLIFSFVLNEPDRPYVETFKLETENVKHIRILLYGPVGAGKSSFISSVRSILRGKMSNLALSNYVTHKVNKGKESIYPFVFIDFMGLNEDSDKGVRLDDVRMAMEGHVKEDYVFNPVAPLNKDSPFYNPSPSPEQKVHVLVCAYSANVLSMNNSVLQKMKAIREAASSLGIPQLGILTHVDEACPETGKDLKNVYKSKHIKKKMQDFSAALGIPLNCILPVKSYSEEIQLNEKVDALILSALRMMLDFGDEFIEYKL